MAEGNGFNEAFKGLDMTPQQFALSWQETQRSVEEVVRMSRNIAQAMDGKPVLGVSGSVVGHTPGIVKRVETIERVQEAHGEHLKKLAAESGKRKLTKKEIAGWGVTIMVAMISQAAVLERLLSP